MRRGQTSRYGNTPTVADGITFDSRLEARRYRELMLLQAAGQIRALTVHPRYELAPAVKLDGRRRPARFYTADFAYEEGPDWHPVVEDTKNPASAAKDVFTLKRHLMMAVHGIEVRCVTKSS